MASKYSAGLTKVVVTLLLIGPAFLLVFISSRGCEHKFKELDDYGKVINYSFEDGDGKHFTSKDFKNEVEQIKNHLQNKEKNLSKKAYSVLTPPRRE
jgi:hypothetical protein